MRRFATRTSSLGKVLGSLSLLLWNTSCSVGYLPWRDTASSQVQKGNTGSNGPIVTDATPTFTPVPGSGTGTSSGTGAGTSSGTGAGTSSGTGAGTSSGTGAGTSSGTGAGTSSGTGAGTSSGTGAGTSSGTGAGTGSGTGTGASDQFSLIMQGQAITAGQCTGGFNVTLLQNGIANVPSGPVTVQFTGPAGVTLSSTSDCNGAAQVVISPPAASSPFYVKVPANTLPGTITITAKDKDGKYAKFDLPVIVQGSGTGNGAPTSIAFTTNNTTVDAGLCVPLTVTLMANGQAVVGSQTDPIPVVITQVPVDPKAVIYDSTNCDQTSVVGSTNTIYIKPGQSSHFFTYTIPTAGTFTLTANASTLSLHSSLTLTVQPVAPVFVEITSGKGTLSAGECAPYTAGLRDVFNNRTSYPNNTTVINIAGIPKSVYTDAGCNNLSADNNFPLAQGNSDIAFYLKVKQANPDPGYTLTPTNGSLTPVSKNIRVIPATANSLVIDSNPSGIMSDFAHSCINFNVSIMDMYGNLTQAVANTTAKLFEQNNRGQLFSGYDCSSTAAPGPIAVVIPAGQMTAKFSFRDDTAEAVTLIATALPAGTLGDGVYPVPPPMMIVAADPSDFTIGALPNVPRAGKCSGLPTSQGGAGAPVSFGLIDAYSNPSPARGNMTVLVTLSGYRDPTVPKIYLDATCSQLATMPNPTSMPNVYQLTVPKGQTGGQFYYSHTVAETFVATLSAPSTVPAMNPRATNLKVSADVAAKLAFLNMPANVSLTAGSCSVPFTVEVRDAYDNSTTVSQATPLSLAADVSLTQPSGFYGGTGNNGCPSATFLGGSAATITLASGAGSTVFYMQDMKVDAFNVRVSGIGSPISVHVTVTSDKAVQATIDTIPAAFPSHATVIAGQCAGPYVLTSRDAFLSIDGNGNPIPGNPSAVPDTTTFNLAAIFSKNHGAVNDLTFFKGSSCAPTTATTSVAIQAGQTQSPPFYLIAKTATPPYADILYATTSRLVTGTLTLTVLAAPPVKLVLRYPPAIRAGLCSRGLIIVAQDTFGNESAPITQEWYDSQVAAGGNPPSSVAIRLATNGDGRFFSDPDCFDQAHSTSFFINNTRAGFYFIAGEMTGGGSTQTISMTPPTTSGLAPAAQDVPVQPGQPSYRTVEIVDVSTGSLAQSTVYMGNCRDFVVRIRDNNHNIVRFPADADMWISGGVNSNLLYPASGCTGVPGLALRKTFATGQLAEFYFSLKASHNDNLNLSAAVPYAGINLYGSHSVLIYDSSCHEGLYLGPVRFCFADAYQTQYVTDCYNSPYAGHPGYYGWVYVWLVEHCDANGNIWYEYLPASRYLGGCFPPEAKIATAGGLPKRADLVETGDELWNPVLRKPVRVKQVVKGPESVPLLEISAGREKITVTSKHPMWTQAGLKTAKELTLKDSLLDADGRTRRITSIRKLPVKDGQQVYNFILDVSGDSADERAIQSNGFVTGEWTLQTYLESLEPKKGRLP